MCSIKFIYPKVSATGILESLNSSLGTAFVKCKTTSDGLSDAGLKNSHLDMEIRSIWCNAYYNYIHNPLLSCLLSGDIIN